MKSDTVIVKIDTLPNTIPTPFLGVLYFNSKVYDLSLSYNQYPSYPCGLQKTLPFKKPYAIMFSSE